MSDQVIYEEFRYPNTRILTANFDEPYIVIKKLSDANYEKDEPNYHIGSNSNIVHASKLWHYYYLDKLKMPHKEN